MGYAYAHGALSAPRPFAGVVLGRVRVRVSLRVRWRLRGGGCRAGPDVPGERLGSPQGPGSGLRRRRSCSHAPHLHPAQVLGVESFPLGAGPAPSERGTEPLVRTVAHTCQPRLLWGPLTCARAPSHPPAVSCSVVRRDPHPWFSLPWACRDRIVRTRPSQRGQGPPPHCRLDTCAPKRRELLTAGLVYGWTSGTRANSALRGWGAGQRVLTASWPQPCAPRPPPLHAQELGNSAPRVEKEGLLSAFPD